MCPNYIPAAASPRRLALVGEAPGRDEERIGRPFVGMSGRFLAALLSRAGMSIDHCFLGNVSQHQPPGNDISEFDWNGPEIQSGLSQLERDLEKFDPNIVVLLGNIPLKAAKDPYGSSGKRVKFSNSNWRGSLFRSTSGPLNGYKCVSTYHPAYALRDYDATPFLQLDLRKAVRESHTDNLTLPNRQIEIPTFAQQAVDMINTVRALKTLTGVDIEGYWNNLKCIGFAPRRDYAVVIPFVRQNGQRYWSLPDELIMWRLVDSILRDREVPKVMMAGLYDSFCLEYGFGMQIAEYVEDIMSKHWALYSELAKDEGRKKGIKGMGLAIQASIYTDEPHYKDEYGSEDDATFYRYNGKDCCVTLEIAERIEEIFNGPGEVGFNQVELASMKKHYRFNMALHHPFRYMSRRGMNYDTSKAEARRKDLQLKLYEAQAKINGLTGHGFDLKKGLVGIRHQADELMLTKKRDRARAEYIESRRRYHELLDQPLSLANLGELESLCEVSLNIRSADQMIKFLYETLGLPTQFTDKRNEKPRPTTDYEALLKLSKICQQEPKFTSYLPIIQTAIEIRALATRENMLGISADKDGRIRCGYNIVGSNTGRVTCYESPTGSGYNLQTIPNYTDKALAPGGVLGDRDLFIPDEGCHMFQCDLKGADGWTVAAYAAMLGDATMLEDYRGGVSPFERLTLKLLGVSIPKEREELKATIKKHVEKDGWPRFSCKRLQHGGCYLEGAITVSRNILKDSEGLLYVPPKECQSLLNFMLDEMYPGVRRYHEWLGRRIKERPVLTAASGQVRQFFGRPDDILTKAVAFEPQANTTYATNLAMYRLWTDPDNRSYWGSPNKDSRSYPEKVYLRVEPLHQVHDALVGQFRIEDTAWAVDKIKSWFANPLTIAGQQIVIPFDGSYGESWGNLKVGKI